MSSNPLSRWQLTRHPTWDTKTAPRGKGKGFHKYVYTLKDIADWTGQKIKAVRNDVYNKKLNPEDYADVIRYLLLKGAICPCCGAVREKKGKT